MVYDEAKFKEFNRLLADAEQGKFDQVVIPRPSVLGDDYEELIENLSRLAEAKVTLEIASPESGASA